MRQPCFCYPVVMFIFIALPMYQVLCPSSTFPMLPAFFYFIFLFFINNRQQRCWILVLFFEFQLYILCQKILIENIMNCSSFWKFQLKCFWTNVFWDFKRFVSFIVQLLWGSIQLDIFVFQPHIVTNLQSLRISSFLIKLLLYVLLCSFYYFCCILLYTSLPVRKQRLRGETTSKPYKPTFLTTCLIAVLQPSRYFVLHSGDTPIQLSLPWRSCSCQCLNTKTSAWGNRGFTTETLSISYNISLYIRPVVTL